MPVNPRALIDPLLRGSLLALLAVSLVGCESAREPEPARSAADLALPPAVAAPATGRPTPLLTPDEDEPPPVERVIERGTGVFTAPPAGRSRASIATDAAGEITLNVVDAELREVVRLVLEDALGASYVIDPAVGGRITIQTTRPLPPEDLVPTLDAVLRMNGAALVQSGDLYQVVPIEQALTSGPMTDVRPLAAARQPGFGVVAVPLRFVAATALAQVLEPFAPPGGAIQVDPTRNLLLLAGSSEQLATLQELVAIFDVDWLQGMSFGLFPLEIATAPELALELDQIFGDTAEGPLAGIVRVIPIERLNAVVVVSAQPAYLDQAATWIARLDREGEGEEPGIYVYNVQNARATNLAEVLGELFAARTTTVGEPSLLAPGQEPVELRSTSGFELGTGDTGEELDEAPGDRERARPRQRARTPVRPLATASSLGQPAATDPDDEIRIIADDTTNALVIQAKPREYRKIQQALEKLDVLPLQVLIEATIAEVTLSDELRYGVEWFFRSGDVRVAFSQATTALPNPVFAGFSALFNSSDVRVVLNALEEVTDVEVISSPQLLVLDNQTARLQVGDQVPITVQQATPITGDLDQIVSSVELRDTGVILHRDAQGQCERAGDPRDPAGGQQRRDQRDPDRRRADHADDQPAPDQQHRRGAERPDRGARRADHRQPRSLALGPAAAVADPDRRRAVQHAEQQQPAHRAAGAAVALGDRQPGGGARGDR